MKSLHLNVLAVLASMMTLSACSGEPRSAKPAEPPPPQPVYIIKHMTPEGTFTYTVNGYSFSYSCISFDLVVDEKLETRSVCGTIEITSKGRLHR